MALLVQQVTSDRMLKLLSSERNIACLGQRVRLSNRKATAELGVMGTLRLGPPVIDEPINAAAILHPHPEHWSIGW